MDNETKITQIDGVVRQLTSGIVISCTACQECMAHNKDVANGTNLIGTGIGTWKKDCLLSVKDHGDRCLAYPNDTEVWLIDSDQNKIKQIL